ACRDGFGDGIDEDPEYTPHRRGDVATLGRVGAAAHLRGKILDALLQGRKYRIKLLDENGRVKIIELDAGLGGCGGGGGGDIGASASFSGGSSAGGGGGPGGGGSSGSGGGSPGGRGGRGPGAPGPGGA